VSPHEDDQCCLLHVALFCSAPSYEHLLVFGCACYPNIATTVPHKLALRSTRCVFLGYSTDHKGYKCLDLSTNHLIVSRHVVFDEDDFPLIASPNLSDLDFLCESGSLVSTIGTPVSLTGSSTAPACQPAPVVPPGFEPQAAPDRPIQRLAVWPPGGPPTRLPLHPAWIHHCAPGRRRRSPMLVIRDSISPPHHGCPCDTADEPSPDGHTRQRQFLATS
jgi:hypothetical protein